MSRTPNDDRSDTMNPNNDAYAADNANRYGDDDLSDDYPADAERESGERPSPRDTRFGPDPHPILGPRSNRLPAIPDLLPWTDELAISFATPESEARDRKLAIHELMSVAAWILERASAVIVRQGNVSTVQKTEDGSTTTLTFGENRALVVRASKELEVVFVEMVNGGRSHVHGVFRFSKLRWRGATPELRGLGCWERRSPRTPEEREEMDEARRRAADVVGYHAETYREVDPVKTIVAAIQNWRPER